MMKKAKAARPASSTRMDATAQRFLKKKAERQENKKKFKVCVEVISGGDFFSTPQFFLSLPNNSRAPKEEELCLRIFRGSHILVRHEHSDGR